MKLKSIGFNSLNIIFEFLYRCILVKKNQAEKIIKKQVQSDKRRSLYKIYWKFTETNHLNNTKETRQWMKHLRRHGFHGKM